MHPQAESILTRHQLRKTTTRGKVLSVFLSREEALALDDLVLKLSELDRVTIYRTLVTFEEKGIIHQAVDGSRRTRYAICSAGCNESAHHDQHAHFRCTTCDQTTCLQDVAIPTLKLPEGYQVERTHLILSGRCNKCKGKSND